MKQVDLTHSRYELSLNIHDDIYIHVDRYIYTHISVLSLYIHDDIYININTYIYTHISVHIV